MFSLQYGRDLAGKQTYRPVTVVEVEQPPRGFVVAVVLGFHLERG